MAACSRKRSTGRGAVTRQAKAASIQEVDCNGATLRSRAKIAKAAKGRARLALSGTNHIFRSPFLGPISNSIVTATAENQGNKPTEQMAAQIIRNKRLPC